MSKSNALLLPATTSSWLPYCVNPDLDQSELRFLCVGDSDVLIKLAGNTVAAELKNSFVAAPVRQIPYRQMGKLWLPSDAELFPAVDPNQLDGLLLGNHSYVWHPSSGLWCFESEHELTLVDLLDLGSLRDGEWNAAMPGIHVPHRVESILARVLPDLSDIDREGQDDIGTQDPKELPGQPGEPGLGPLSQLSRGIQYLAAIAAQQFANAMPATASKRTWVNSLGDWAGSQLQRVSSQMMDARNREVNRLLDMLDKSPDEGLKFAIPFAGDAYRGLASAGGRLIEHGIDFSLSGGSDGRPAEIWDIPWQYQQRLIEKYRDLANREVRLGRHRRAAYIFATLLGDHHAAAGALRQGRRFREAAVLYRKRINQPHQALECLIEGGLWAEAIELCFELSEFERAGDLYSQIGQRSQAIDQYEREVARAIASNDQLNASRVVQTKLEDPMRAIGLLADAWPSSPQAYDCMKRLFELCGAYGQHDTANAWIDHLTIEPHDIRIVSLLSQQAIDYPDRQLAARAADQTRRVASRKLPTASTSDVAALVQAVTRLNAADRLLARDGNAFVERRRKIAYQQRPPRTHAPTGLQLRPLRSFRLTAGVRWMHAVAFDGTVYAAGLRSRRDIGPAETVLIRFNSRGEIQTPTGQPWTVTRPSADWPLTLHRSTRERQLFVHHPQQMASSAAWSYAASEDFPDVVRIQTTSGRLSQGQAIHTGLATRIWAIGYVAPSWRLFATGLQGEILFDMAIENALIGDAPLPDVKAQIHSRKNETYFSLGENLYRLGRNHAIEHLGEFGQVHQLCGTQLGTRTRVAAATENGLNVFWDADTNRDFKVNNESPQRLCFTLGGTLVAVSDTGIRAYSTQDTQVNLLCESSIGLDDVIAVLDLGHSRQIGVVNEAGLVQIFELA